MTLGRKQKRKIIHLVEDLEVGGLEKVVSTIVLGVNKHKYEVEIWCLAAGGSIADELEKKGIKVRIIGLRSYHNPIAVLKLAWLLRRERVNIVHTHGYFPGVFGRLSGFLAHTPRIIAHIHTMKKRKAFIEKTFSHISDKIVCVSGAVQEFIINEEGVKKEKTLLIHNGIETIGETMSPEERQKQKKLLGFDQNDIILTVVASITKHKGHRVLLDAFSRVLKSNPKLKLLIVGDGPLMTNIEKQAHELNVSPNVKFVGLRSDVPILLDISDIFILPSVEKEGLGLSIIEALAMKKPVIGSELGGIPEIVQNGENGFLVPPGDPDKLSEAIELLVNDSHLREQMGKMGRRVFEERFTKERMINALEATYDSLQ